MRNGSWPTVLFSDYFSSVLELNQPHLNRPEKGFTLLSVFVSVSKTAVGSDSINANKAPSPLSLIRMIFGLSFGQPPQSIQHLLNIKLRDLLFLSSIIHYGLNERDLVVRFVLYPPLHDFDHLWQFHDLLSRLSKTILKKPFQYFLSQFSNS